MKNDLIEDFVSDKESLVYTRYCEIFPELIHSDFMVENIQDIEDFINTFMENEFKKYIEKRENEKNYKNNRP